MSGPRVFHQVEVADVVTETDEACSVVFTLPPELVSTFAYRPGQFLTVRIPHDHDGSVARCYSLSSSPHTGDQHTITVKRMAGGHASNWIADHVRAGAVLDVLPPAGTFCPASLDDDFLLFAAGSGITPVMSILKSALARGRGRVVLCYANRDERSVIFAAQLRRLAEEAGPRLAVVHWLDSLQGAPTPAALAALARPYAGYEAFLCGPDPFMATVRDALREVGVPAQRIHAERFLSLAENPFEATPDEGGVAATLQVTLDGEERKLNWPPGTRMLDLLLAEGLDAPYSCREGVCGACACQLTSGEVTMAHNEALEEADLADGFILACQAIPLTAEVSITY
ncbi:MAG TPA: ferredoxin--NADP reductase [Streptosporangiaceae bacterium]|nr:ferredoxin--NADP reductase [Streptosporangiaceae bacterium]